MSSRPPEGDDVAPSPARDPASVMRSRQFVAVLVLAAVVGVVASLAAWCFLELVYAIQVGAFETIPKALGLEPTPSWWYPPVLGIAGVITAFAIVRLPGRGGHVPAKGLNPSPTQPEELPGVVLAAFASIGLGLVLGPEAPLLALGGGLGFLAVRLVRRDAPPELGTLVASASTFAALSFLFGSPVIAAVILIEVAGLDRARMPLVLVPGLLAAGIGSLVSIGMGTWTGVDQSAIALSALPLPTFDRPDPVDFLWTIPLAAAVSLGTVVIFRLARKAEPVAAAKPFLILPAIGVAVAGLAVAFSYVTDRAVDEVLFSGQDALGPLIAGAGTWSLGALALVLAFKGLAYALSLAGFRGGPIFPAMFLGAAAGLLASHLPGFAVTPAVAVGIGAAVASALRLPLAAVVLATLLTSGAGLGAGPLIIVGVVVSYLTALALDGRLEKVEATADEPQPASPSKP